MSNRNAPTKYAYLILSCKSKNGNDNIPIKSNLTIIFKELKTEFTRPIRLLGTLLNKYVVRKILTPALVIPIIKFPIKKIQINLYSDIK